MGPKKIRKTLPNGSKTPLKKSRKTMPKKIKSTDDDSPTKANGFKMDYKKYSGLCEITVKPCRHLMKLKNSDFKNSSLCNPLQWSCNHGDCSANESLMACLQCSHVACGKYIENHALEHYKQTKHPIMMNIDDQTLYCYRCDDFQMNDDFYMFGGHETIKSLRHRVNMLILERNSTNQNAGRVSMRSRRNNKEEKLLKSQDVFAVNHKALWCARMSRCRKFFRNWKNYYYDKKEPQNEEKEDSNKKEIDERLGIDKLESDKKKEKSSSEKAKSSPGKSVKFSDDLGESSKPKNSRKKLEESFVSKRPTTNSRTTIGSGGDKTEEKSEESVSRDKSAKDPGTK